MGIHMCMWVQVLSPNLKDNSIPELSGPSIFWLGHCSVTYGGFTSAKKLGIGWALQKITTTNGTVCLECSSVTGTVPELAELSTRKWHCLSESSSKTGTLPMTILELAELITGNGIVWSECSSSTGPYIWLQWNWQGSVPEMAPAVSEQAHCRTRMTWLSACTNIGQCQYRNMRDSVLVLADCWFGDRKIFEQHQKRTQKITVPESYG